MSGDLSIGNQPSFFQNLANLEENPKLKLTLKVMGVVVGVLATMAIVAGIGGALSLGGVHIFAVLHSPYNIAMVAAGGAGLITASVIIVVGFTVKYLNRQKAEKQQDDTAKSVKAGIENKMGIEKLKQELTIDKIERHQPTFAGSFCSNNPTVKKLYNEHGLQLIIYDGAFEKIMHLKTENGQVYLENVSGNAKELETLLEAEDTDKFITDFKAFNRLATVMDDENMTFEEALKAHPEIADKIFYRNSEEG